jgi:pyrroline-5-carboxylate reductase
MGKKIGILGVGKMGGILLNAFLQQGLTDRNSVRGTVLYEDLAEELTRDYGLPVGTDNRAVAEWADIILFCVKPKTVAKLVKEIAPVVNPEKMIISVAASVQTRDFEQNLPEGIPVVRAMPNTPCSVNCGMTAICKGAYATDNHIKVAVQMFDLVGRTVVLEEDLFDAVTGMSASGPAYIYIILESLAEAGVKVGLPREVSTLLAAQTALGASKVVLETGSHPALLKDAVTTPAGCTIDGIMELEEGKLRVTLIKAVVKAVQRASELVNG